MADAENTQTENQLVESTEKTEAETQSATTTPTATEKQPGSGVFTLLLLLIVAAATAGGGFYLWQQQQSLVNQQQTDIANLQQRLQQLKNNTSALQPAIQNNSSLIQRLDNRQQQIEEISQRAITVTNRGQRDWILAEIDYLLRIANRRLQVARDINGAIAALTGADQRLHDLGDLTLFPVRQQLAKDIANLKALHQVDVNGTALALDAMIGRLNEIPFKTVQDEVKAQFENLDTTVKQPQDDNFVDSVINTVMNIGDIKIQHRSIEPASSAEQQQQIEQILRTHLLGARLAVLRYDQQQYAHDIEQSIQLLHLHYKTDDNRVAQMKTDLSNYAAINLIPDLPIITGTWKMLQDVLQGTNPELMNKNTEHNKSSARQAATATKEEAL